MRVTLRRSCTPAAADGPEARSPWGQAASAGRGLSTARCVVVRQRSTSRSADVTESVSGPSTRPATPNLVIPGVMHAINFYQLLELRRVVMPFLRDADRAVATTD